MNKKALLASVLAGTMLLSGCSLVVKDEAVDAATVIAKVGEHEFTKSEVQTQVTSYLSDLKSYYSNYYGYTIDTTSSTIIESAQNTVVNALVENAVVEDKMKELGVYDLTEDEQNTVNEQWNSYTGLFSSYLGEDSGMTEEEKEAYVAQMIYYYFGQTKSGMETELRTEKLKEIVYAEGAENGSIKVTDEDVEAQRATEVSDAKSAYESDLGAYGTAVLNGETVYYRPAGYRNVQSILVKFNEADSSKVTDLTTKATAQGTAASTALTAAQSMDVDFTALGVPEDTEDKVAYLADMITVTVNAEEVPVATEAPAAEAEATEAPAAEATAEPAAEATAEPVVETETVLTPVVADTLPEGIDETLKSNLVAYKTALAEQEWYTNAAAAAREAAYAAIDEKADAALARLDAGEDFTAVMYEVTEDPGMQEGADHAATGYAVCSATTGFVSEYVTAAMEIANVGEHSGKVRCDSYGYFIINYASDVAEGEVDAAEVHDAIYADLLETAQSNYYDAKVEAWVAAAGAKIDLKPLSE